MLHFFSHSLWSLFLSFLYRYYVLLYSAPRSKTLILVLLGFYSFSFFQFVRYFSVTSLTRVQCYEFIKITFNFAGDPPEVMIQIIKNAFPDYETEGRTISGTANVLRWNALFTILHMTVPVTPAYIVIIYVRRAIILRLSGQSMSENTKAIHRQLLMVRKVPYKYKWQALTFQALLPAIYSVAVVSYALGQFGICNHPFLEYFSFIILGFIPCLSPLGSLYFIRPYKNWLKRKVFRREDLSGSRSTYAQRTSGSTR